MSDGGSLPGVYAVGQVIPDWKAEECSQGSHLSIGSNGLLLMLILDVPTIKEIESFSSTNVHVAIVNGGKHTLFMLFNMDGVAKEWIDSPYAIGLVAPEFRRLTNRRPDTGYVTTIMLVNLADGVLRAMRFFTVSPQMSGFLDTFIAHQRRNLYCFTRTAHDREIAAMYARCPRPRDMLPLSAHTEQGGIAFPRSPR